MSSVRRRSTKRKLDIEVHSKERMNGVLYDGRSRLEADTHTNRFVQSMRRLAKKTAHGAGALVRMPVELVQRLRFNHQVGRRNKKREQESVLQGKVPYYKPQLNLSGEKKGRPTQARRTDVRQQLRLQKQLQEEEELAERIRHAQKQMQTKTVQESEKELDFRPLYTEETVSVHAQIEQTEKTEGAKVLPLRPLETPEEKTIVEPLRVEPSADVALAGTLEGESQQGTDSQDQQAVANESPNETSQEKNESLVAPPEAERKITKKVVAFTPRLRAGKQNRKDQEKLRPTGTDGTGTVPPAPLSIWKKGLLSVLTLVSLCGIGYGGWYFFEGRYSIITINDDGTISQVRTAEKDATAVLEEAQVEIDPDDLVTMTKVVTAQEQADAANQAAAEEPQLTAEELAGEAQQEEIQLTGDSVSSDEQQPSQTTEPSDQTTQTDPAEPTDDANQMDTAETDDTIVQTFDASMFEDKVVAAELTEEVDDGYTIVIQRARNLTVNVEGETTPVRLAVGTVEDALNKGGIAYDEDDAISPSLDTPIEEGLEIHIKRAFDVSIQTMKETINVRIAEGTVADALNKAGITYSASDELSPSADTQLEAGMKIELTTVEVKYEEKTYSVAYKTIEQKSNKVNRGTTKVSRQGKNGVRTVTERVTYKNGVETGRAVVSDKITTAAVNKIVLVGTRAPVNPAIDDLPEGGPTSSMIKRTVVVDQITAYTHTGNRTATGKWPMIGMCAVNTSQFAFGTKFYIPGYGYAVAEDTGANTSSEVCIDVFMDTKADCTRWGRKRNVKVYVLK